MEKGSLYRCISKFNIPTINEYGILDRDQRFEIIPNSIWEIQGDECASCTGAELVLKNIETNDYIDISIKTLAEYFEVYKDGE